MNERIKELAEQALNEYNATYHNEAKIPEAYLKKFAELIVRECLGISYKESHLPNAILFDERSDKFIKDVHNRIDRATKKHFGVEE
jgi:hypothetical protein